MHNITVKVPGYEHVGVNYNSDWSGTAYVLLRKTGGKTETIELPAPVLQAFMLRKAEVMLERVVDAVQELLKDKR